jgi:peptide/nickel transport system permease protein
LRAYLLRRLSFAAVLVLTVSSASLVLARLAPGDYVTVTLGIDARRETAEALRARYGLNRSMSEQYRDWLLHAVRLDFGRSLLYDTPVSTLVAERAANTALLAAAALIVATLAGLPLGVITGSRRGALPRFIRSVSLLFLSLPSLLTSLVLVAVAARTGWFPIGDMRSTGAVTGPAFAVVDLLWHLVVPATALALPIAATFERLQSQAMADVMGQPYVLAALARGVPRSRVVWRDGLKAALRPLAAVYGLAVGALFSGSFAVEVVTAWPGLGRLMLEALRARDLYLVAGCAAVGSMFLALGTLLSDVLLAIIDPRSVESRESTEAIEPTDYVESTEAA